MIKQKTKIKKGDTVVVLSGKDGGKKGKVIEVIVKRNKVVIEGVNVAKKHQRPTRNFPGGIIDRALPIFACRVMLVCPRCSKPTRIGAKELEERRVRICKKCGEIVDKV